MTIKATTRFGCEVSYEGTREDLISCGLATDNMFPVLRQQVRTKRQGYPAGKAKNAAGRVEWVVYREKGGRFTVMYTNEYLELSTERA